MGHVGQEAWAQPASRLCSHLQPGSRQVSSRPVFPFQFLGTVRLGAGKTSSPCPSIPCSNIYCVSQLLAKGRPLQGVFPTLQELLPNTPPESPLFLENCCICYSVNRPHDCLPSPCFQPSLLLLPLFSPWGWSLQPSVKSSMYFKGQRKCLHPPIIYPGSPTRKGLSFFQATNTLLTLLGQRYRKKRGVSRPPRLPRARLHA